MTKKILLINFGGIGDQILFFPVIKTIREKYEDSFITFVTEPRSKSAVKLTSGINELFICDIKSPDKYIEALKLIKKALTGRYDIVVSSGSSILVSILLILTGIKQRIGYNTGFISKILLTDTVTLNQNQYASNMYHDLVSGFDSNKEAVIPEVTLNIDDEKKEWLDKLISDPDVKRPKVVIHPGVSALGISKGILKFWAENNWAELIEKMISSQEYTVILTGGPDDKKVLSCIKEKFKKSGLNKDYLLDLSEKNFSLDEFAYILYKSDALICVDSAPMHIAVGLGKKVIALFGPTDEKKLLPKSDERFIAVKNDGIKCRPCLWDKRQTSCRKTDCLDIQADNVIKHLKKLVLRARKKSNFEKN